MEEKCAAAGSWQELALPSRRAATLAESAIATLADDNKDERDDKIEKSMQGGGGADEG